MDTLVSTTVQILYDSISISPFWEILVTFLIILPCLLQERVYNYYHILNKTNRKKKMNTSTVTTAVIVILMIIKIASSSATPDFTVDDCYDIYETTAGIKQCIDDVEVYEDMLDDEADWKNSLGRTGY